MKMLIKPGYLFSQFIGIKVARQIALAAKSSGKPTFFVGVEGPSSAGKTTFAQTLDRWLRIRCGIAPLILSSDQVLLSREEREQMKAENRPAWEDEQSWYRFDLLFKIMSDIQSARHGDTLKYENTYNDGRTDHHLALQVPNRSPTIVIVEGIYLLRSELQTFYDYLIYLNISKEISIERQKARARQRGYEWPQLKEQIDAVYNPSYDRYLQNSDLSPNLIIDAITFRRFLSKYYW